MDFVLRVPVGFTVAEPSPAMPDGVTLAEIHGHTKIMVARGPATSAVSDAQCRATSGLRLAPSDHAEAWEGSGEGGCRYWATVGGEALIETRMNRGPIAHAVICVGPDAPRVQSICDVMVRALVIEPPRTVTLRGQSVPVPPGWTVGPALALRGLPNTRGEPLMLLIGPSGNGDDPRPAMIIHAPSKATLDACAREGRDCDRTPPEITCFRRTDDDGAARACETVTSALFAQAG